VPSLSSAEVTKLMQQLEGWDLFDRLIGKVYNFTNYYQTMAFVNAVAWISHREDHHPDIILSYNKCRVEYTTHAVGGLSENDFICAAKIDVLFKILS
jgi:4a-hydroxytetrahydrobiopterin dehydratase